MLGIINFGEIYFLPWSQKLDPPAVGCIWYRLYDLLKFYFCTPYQVSTSFAFPEQCYDYTLNLFYRVYMVQSDFLDTLQKRQKLLWIKSLQERKTFIFESWPK